MTPLLVRQAGHWRDLLVGAFSCQSADAVAHLPESTTDDTKLAGRWYAALAFWIGSFNEQRRGDPPHFSDGTGGAGGHSVLHY